MTLLLYRLCAQQLGLPRAGWPMLASGSRVETADVVLWWPNCLVVVWFEEAVVSAEMVLLLSVIVVVDQSGSRSLPR